MSDSEVTQETPDSPAGVRGSVAPPPEQEVTNTASSAWPVQWTLERSRGQGHQAGSGAKWVAARGSRTWRRRLAARDPQKQAWRQGPGTG